jgi:hypothetical protein
VGSHLGDQRSRQLCGIHRPVPVRAIKPTADSRQPTGSGASKSQLLHTRMAPTAKVTDLVDFIDGSGASADATETASADSGVK